MSDITSTAILIVKDSATRAALAAVLEHAHRLLHASNGAEGIRLARVERPDLDGGDSPAVLSVLQGADHTIAASRSTTKE